MPSFKIDISDKKDQDEIEFEYEVWCATCGDGICGNVQKRARGFSYRRADEIRIEPCEKCIQNAKEEIGNEKEEKISELESKIEELEQQLKLLASQER